MELHDIIGQKIGQLLVVEYSRSCLEGIKRQNKVHYYNCKCDCGNVKEIRRSNLISAGSTSCGCRNGNSIKFNPNDIVGKSFANLLVVKYIDCKFRNCGRFCYSYECQCQCGNTTVVDRQNLLFGHTKSCGCLKKITGKSNKDWKGYEEISGRYWTHIINHAATRKIIHSVSIEEAWNKFVEQKGCCALSGVKIFFKSGKTEQTASFDRIDSKKGYVIGNIQWLHKKVNLMKMAMNEKELIEWCALITNKNG